MAGCAAKNLQLDELPLLITPHPLNDLTPDEVRDLARGAYPVDLKQLTGQGELAKQRRSISSIRRRASRRAAKSRGGADERGTSPDASVIELEDSWEAVNAWFLEHDLTDGLPIVPPTAARVAAMTDYVERDARLATSRRRSATLAPKRGLATVEKIAANAVMAGCMPEYMPVLIACVKAIAHPEVQSRCGSDFDA